ncbi:MAG TPA: oligosaccharide flippase family protein [Pyrinomonadaceae bacterium]|jgi:O-antigen/teichoic acid export membrane protein|nr:oligosaccharide flippase family protein [Pyrinomonadaceae bacterium]
MLKSLTVRTFITNSAIMSLGLVHSILLSRWLGPEGRGEVAAAMLWPLLIGYLVSMGLIPAILYFASLPESKIKTVFANSIFLAVGQTLIAWPIGFIALPWLLTSQRDAVISISRVYLLVVPFYLISQYVISILQGRLDFSAFNRLRTVIPIGYLSGIVVLKLTGNLTLVYIVVLHLCLFIVLLTSGLIALWRSGFHFSLRPDAGLGKQMLKYGSKVGVGELSQAANLRLDQALMATWLQPRELGLYVVAVSAGTLSQVLSNAVRMVVIPSIAKKSTQVERIKVLQAAFRKYLLISFLTTIIIAVCLPSTITIIFGISFKGAIWPAEVLLLASLLIGAKDVLAGGAQALGNPWLGSRAELLSLIVTLVLLPTLLPRIGIMGGAIASVAAYGTQLVIVARSLEIEYGLSPMMLFRVGSKDVAGLYNDIGLFNRSRLAELYRD